MRGTCLLWKGEPMVVVDKEIFAPGKGAAVARLKLKSIKTGRVLTEVVKTTEMVEDAEVEHRQVDYSYDSGSAFVFVDPRSYEQFEADPEVVGEDARFLQEGDSYGLMIYEGKVISVQPPKKVIFKIEQAEEAVRGDTVTAGTKSATLSNGTVVKVPLFIRAGDEIIINTETGEYVGKRN